MSLCTSALAAAKWLKNTQCMKGCEPGGDSGFFFSSSSRKHPTRKLRGSERGREWEKKVTSMTMKPKVLTVFKKPVPILPAPGTKSSNKGGGAEVLADDCGSTPPPSPLKGKRGKKWFSEPKKPPKTSGLWQRIEKRSEMIEAMLQFVLTGGRSEQDRALRIGCCKSGALSVCNFHSSPPDASEGMRESTFSFSFCFFLSFFLFTAITREKKTFLFLIAALLLLLFFLPFSAGPQTAGVQASQGEDKDTVQIYIRVNQQAAPPAPPLTHHSPLSQPQSWEVAPFFRHLCSFFFWHVLKCILQLSNKFCVLNLSVTISN